MNADLHCHSTASDGLLPPVEVVERGHWRGVDMLALTDHDETVGLVAARERAEHLGLRFINGVEISVSWKDDTVHIVGLNIDPANPALDAGLSRIRATRDGRAQRIAEALEAEGVPDALAGALKYAGNPELISRAHFARYLAALGYARDVKSVFDHYLATGKPGFVPHAWATLEEALAWITGSGGVAVLAHPGRCRFKGAEMRDFLSRFREAGGEGIEVLSGAHSPENTREFADLAKAFGLLASRASDFHGPGESRIDLGGMPELPEGLTPVWQRFS